MDSRTLTDRIKEEARRLGFHRVGMAPAEPGPHSAFLDTWLARGHAADMAYLARDPEKRKDPRRVVPGARSVVVCALGYYPGRPPSPRTPLPPRGRGVGGEPGHGIVSRYARGRDYHDVVKEKLLALQAFVVAEAGEPVEGRAYVDTGPVLEREVAALAGVGQFGKNTMLITRGLGSYFFIGALILTLPLEYDEPAVKDICGRCTRCLDACPTGAFPAPYELDARRCISYLTIENRGAIPAELREGTGDRIFGCDICQEVCPWNRRVAASPPPPPPNPGGSSSPPCPPEPGGDLAPPYPPEPGGVEPPSLLELLRLSQEEFSARFRGSPIKRARRSGLLRNAAVALGNQRDPASVPGLAAALSDPEPLVRAHAAWALGRIGTPEALGALEAALSVEEDAAVRGKRSRQP